VILLLLQNKVEVALLLDTLSKPDEEPQSSFNTLNISTSADVKRTLFEELLFKLPKKEKNKRADTVR